MKERDLIEQILETMSAKDLMNATGVSERIAYAWKSGLRNPSRKHQRALMEHDSIDNEVDYCKKKNIRSADVLNMFRDEVIQYIKSAPIIIPPPLNIKSGGGSPETMVAQVSDLQSGHKTKSTNLDILRIRIQRFTERLIRIATVQAADHKIRGLVLFFLGDFIQNEIIGKLVSQHELETTAYRQFKFVYEEFKKAITQLFYYFKKVNIYCVTGNHGRMSQDSDDANWDHLLYEFLDVYFKDQKDINIIYPDPGEFFLYTEVENTRFLLIHGDRTKSYQGLPYYSLSQKALKLYNALETYDYMCCGHWHNIAEIPANKLRVLVNGSFMSDDMYALERYGVTSDPMQLAYSVHPEEGISAKYNIYLAKKNERIPIKIHQNNF